MPKVFNCSDCEKNYQTGRGLRKHFQAYPSHRREENVKRPPLQAAAAANIFLDVPAHHRSARLKELLKLLTREEFSTVVLRSISRHVSTSSFLLSKSKLTQGTVSKSKLREELEVLVAMVAECYPDSLLYSLKQQSVSSLFYKPQHESVYPNYHSEKKLLTPAKCREWVNFIDDLNIPQDQQQTAQLVDFVISHKDGEFFKSTLMPVVFKKNFNHFVQFAAGLVSNFDIGYTKYQNIVRNQLGKELEHIFGINIMVPKDDMCEKVKTQKEALQESLSLNFTEHNGVVAAYTNVKNTVEWLLSKETLQETIMVPKEKIITYHYIDAFPWMQWSKFFTGETAIRVKLVEPHNLLSSIVTVCSWLGPDDYNHVSNLGRETLQQLSSLKSVYHPLLKKNIEVIVRGVADGCQRRLITGNSSASSTYPIPESPEHRKQLGDMRVICNEPVWKVEMTEKGEEQYKTWLGKRVDNTENRLLLNELIELLFVE